MELKRVYQTISREMAALSESLKKEISSVTGRLSIENNYISHSRGKHLRPAMFFLSYYTAQAYKKNIVKAGPDTITTAAAIELIHTATLMHDDIIDNATTRRWKKSVNSSYGNATAVLFGDFLLAKAFTMLSAAGERTVLRILSETAREMAVGEINQTLNQSYPGCGNLSETEYLKSIEQKTASFFSSCCKCGAIAGDSGAAYDRFAGYGMHLGTAYQILDDCIDLIGDEKIEGKTLRTDPKSGKFTLPLIYLLQEIPAQERTGNKKYPTLMHVWEKYAPLQKSALEKTAGKIRHYIHKAKQELSGLPCSVYSEALEGLTKCVYNQLNFY